MERSTPVLGILAIVTSTRRLFFPLFIAPFLITLSDFDDLVDPTLGNACLLGSADQGNEVVMKGATTIGHFLQDCCPMIHGLVPFLRPEHEGHDEREDRKEQRQNPKVHIGEVA